jgi:16S rRNA (guanine966-N2)-methyltransferase
MHIIAGTLKGHVIQFPKNGLFRPTKSVVREAVFSMLSGSIQNSCFLDLCSGSGAMGFEAISRGASSVVCVDQNVTYLNQNAKRLNVDVKVVRANILSFLAKTTQRFNIIYLDPVWAHAFVYQKAMLHIFNRQVLCPGGFLFVEHDSHVDCQANFPEHFLRCHRYGNTLISRFSI